MTSRHDKPKRWQFRLSTLLIATTLCGVTAGIAGPVVIQKIQDWQTPSESRVISPFVRVYSHQPLDEQWEEFDRIEVDSRER